jgi:hypothetical protein
VSRSATPASHNRQSSVMCGLDPRIHLPRKKSLMKGQLPP